MRLRFSAVQGQGARPLLRDGEANVDDFKFMMRYRAGWEKRSVHGAEAMMHSTRENILKMIGFLFSDVDRDVFAGKLFEFLRATTQEGNKAGAYGAIDDSLAAFKPSFSYGKWLASRVPQAEAHLEQNGGHMSMFAHRIPEVRRWLASKF
jgi:hypothetical protein